MATEAFASTKASQLLTEQVSVFTMTQIDYYSFSRGKFDTQVQLPICKRSAIHRKVIVVSVVT